jgi:enoyl-CoA hydratase/3-hydroxyacyl-CoA dehydrogenase
VNRLDAKRTEDILAFTRRGHELLRRFATTPKVVIAKVDGLSLGGGSELALACDWIVATKRASFGFPETGIGIYPGLGGTQRLPRRIGVALAKAFIFTGNTISADAASEIGMLDRAATRDGMKAAILELVGRGKPGERRAPASPPKAFEGLVKLFPAGRTVDEVLALANKPSSPEDQKIVDRVRAKAPVALRIANELIEGAARWPIDEGIERELAHLGEIFGTQDAYVGLSSLGGRTRPQFTGK